jgi:uncharacterized protein (DUF488 family)
LSQNKTKHQCYTIGHSNHPIKEFIDLLKLHGIDCVVDVRSSPYSSYTPQYNKNDFRKKVQEYGIDYVYLGNRVGGRYQEKKYLFPNGTVNYGEVRKSTLFNTGISKILSLLSNHKAVSLMCSEKEPFDCHRFVLVSFSLSKMGIEVLHILEDGVIVSNKALEKRLINMYGQKTLSDSFSSPKDKELESLYEKRNLDIAYSIE